MTSTVWILAEGKSLGRLYDHGARKNLPKWKGIRLYLKVTLIDNEGKKFHKRGSRFATWSHP